MTHEERTVIREKIAWKSSDLLERLERFCSEVSGLTLMQMGEVSDILKDLSEVEKNMAKVHLLEREHPIHDEKKY
jgi:hypothetical protein